MGEIVGWVWRPGSQERLKVELRSGTVVVASTVADIGRDDLSANGVGDGFHAFRLLVPTDVDTQSTSHHVFAVDMSGMSVMLEDRHAVSREGEQLEKMRRTLDLLICSHRLLHRNLQAALLKQGPSPEQVLVEVSGCQERLAGAIATVELFAIRIEQMLSARESSGSGESGWSSNRLKLLIALSVASFGCSCAALWRSLVPG
jgi:hypothetical protein